MKIIDYYCAIRHNEGDSFIEAWEGFTNWYIVEQGELEQCIQ